MKRTFALILVACTFIQICPSDQQLSALEKFVQRYAPPAPVIELLEQHKELVLQKIKDRGSLPQIPNYFIKVADQHYGQARLIHRVINAQRLRNFLQKNHLHNLEVVKKYIYRLKGMWVMRSNTPVWLEGKWIVVAEKVNFKREQLHVSLQECQELTLLAEKAGYRDWGTARAIKGQPYSGNNWVRNQKTGKLICIDTEDRSFEAGTDVNISGYALKVVLGYLADDITKHCASRFKTRHWLRKHRRRSAHYFFGKSLNHSRLYDDPDINFEEVKRQWALVYQQCSPEELVLKNNPPKVGD